MDAARFSQRDRSPSRFAIQSKLNAASLRFSLSGCSHKKLAEDVFYCRWLHPMPQDSAPGAIVWHFLALKRKELTQFMAAQFRPVGHATTAILSCQFGEQSNQQQARQRVWQTTSVPLIRYGLQTRIQRLQIKHQCFLGKRKMRQKWCIVHRKTFRGIIGIVLHPSLSHDWFVLFPTLQQPWSMLGSQEKWSGRARR